jgi:protease-4
MNLVRGAWRVLVGIKDVLVLLFMLIFFGALAMAFSARPGTRSIGNGALVLELKGSIVEQPASISPTQALSGGGQAKQYRLRDVVAALDAAATDDRVKTVVLDLDGFLGGGQVALGDVAAALDKVKAKKPVLAFATGYSDDAYQLAAHASEIWLDPMGLALFQGPGGSRLYYKGLLEKVGANVHVYRVGKFKSAVEPYILDKQSPEAKEASQALAASLWQGWQAEVGKARPKAQLAAFVADPASAVTAAGDPATAALKAGIVDKLADRAAFNKRVAALAGAGRKDEAYARIELKPYIAANRPKEGDKAIGVVTVAGVIEDGEAEAGTAGGETIGKIIDRAVAADKYKALVLRVDSPGGSALASERIRSALVAARAKGLPVVVSMGNVAASGGYWVSMASDKVFAEPTTITGSIGIFGIIPTFENSLKKVGITTDGVTTTPLSGQPDVVGGTNSAFDSVVQTSIEAGYRRFIGLVSGARKMAPEKVNEIAQGRVWDGGNARQLGLVDAFGGIDDAIAEAARRAKLNPDEPHAVWLEKEPGWGEAISAIFGAEEEGSVPTDLLSTLARARMASFAGVAEDARLMMSASAVQARCLECPVAAVPLRSASVMQLFARWIGL